MKQKKAEITKNWSELMDDGANAANYYLNDAIEKIDSKFGKGYTKEHPELAGAYINAASRETHGAVIAKAILELRNSTDEFNNELTDVLMHNND